MNPLYVGIDVSSKSNVVYLMLPNGDKHSNFKLKTSPEHATTLSAASSKKNNVL